MAQGLLFVNARPAAATACIVVLGAGLGNLAMAAAMNWANVPGYGGADDNPSPGVTTQGGNTIPKNRL
jgi:hypothetical protein